MRRSRWLAVTAAAGVIALAFAASVVAKPATSGPIKIGISLSNSGDFSDPGKAVKRGYQLWAAYVNAHGGLLGRKVQLKIVDDASNPNQAVTNYQNLINKDHVDLVFGPFSSLLTGPSATVARRYGYAFLEPAGGGPAVFALKLPNLFFVQPAPVINCGDPFVHWVLSLPKSARPKTASYTALDDPFASPIADRMRSQFEKAGIKTLYHTIYPAETTDMTPIVEKAIAKKPDMIVGGTQSLDTYGQVKALVQAKYNPKFLFFANGASSPTDFPQQGGREERERDLQLHVLGPAGEDVRQQDVRQGVPEEVRREPVRDRRQLGRGLGRGPGAGLRRDGRPARSATRRSSRPSTTAPGRRSWGISTGTPTARRTAWTGSSSGSSTSCCSSRRRPSRCTSRPIRSRPGGR